MAINNTEGGLSRNIAFPPRFEDTGIPRLQLSLEQWWEQVKDRFAYIHKLVIDQDNDPENYSRRTIPVKLFP